MDNIDIQFAELRQQINKLKDGVDKCFIPSIYIHTYKIASIVKSIDQNKLNGNQKNVLSKLDDDTLKQFERLSKGRCSCRISNDI